MFCLIDVFTKYVWFKALDEKAKTVHHGFFEILNESKLKPKKLWVDEGREFYNKLMQKWLGCNSILMYSTYNKGKSVVDRFIRTLKGTAYKKVTPDNNSSYFGYLNKLIDKCTNTYHCSIIFCFN